MPVGAIGIAKVLATTGVILRVVRRFRNRNKQKKQQEKREQEKLALEKKLQETEAALAAVLAGKGTVVVPAGPPGAEEVPVDPEGPVDVAVPAAAMVSVTA